jgi:GNAT superfamily N-acetyltransferase
VSSVRFQAAGPEAAAEVHRLTKLAFAGYTWLTPPSGAIHETEDDVRRDLATHGGVLGRLDGTPVAAARFRLEPRHLVVRRVAVDPRLQGQGVGKALMEWVHRIAAERGYREVRLGVRAQLPGNRDFYEGLGYRVVRKHTRPGTGDAHWFEMARVVGEEAAGLS